MCPNQTSGVLAPKGGLIIARSPDPWFIIPNFYFAISILLSFSLFSFGICLRKLLKIENLLVFWAYCLNLKAKAFHYIFAICAMYFKWLSAPSLKIPFQGKLYGQKRKPSQIMKNKFLITDVWLPAVVKSILFFFIL